MRRLLCLAPLVLAACGRGAGSTTCGIAALAGPLALLEQFGVPQRTLSRPPAKLPERLVARIVAGPTLTALMGHTDSSLAVGIEGTVPATAAPQFGVLVVNLEGRALGVMLYDTPPVASAPVLGQVALAGRSIPLLGVEVDLANVENPRCPFFPDSTLK